MEYQQRINDAIAVYRSRSGSTLAKLAEDIGVSPNTLTQRIGGESEWKASELARLHEITGMSLDEVFAQ